MGVGVTGRRSLLGQVVPFCTLSLTGLVVSTVAVGIAVQAAGVGSAGPTPAACWRPIVAAYGSLWVVQYVLADRVLFRARPGPSGTQGHGGRSVSSPSWLGGSHRRGRG